MSFIGSDVQEVVCGKALKTISGGFWELGRWGEEIDVSQKFKMAGLWSLGQVVSPCQLSEGGKPASRYSLSLVEAG